MGMTPQQIDERIASKDFYHRIKALNITEGDNSIWWPAIKFTGLNDFISSVNSDFDEDDTDTSKLKALGTVQYRNLMSKSRHSWNEKPGLAYLLGRGTFALLPQSQPEILDDFYSRYVEIEEESKTLVDLVMRRVDNALDPEEGRACEPEAIKTRTVGVGKMTGKTIEFVDDDKPAANVTKRDRKKCSDVLSIHESGYVPSAEKGKNIKRGRKKRAVSGGNTEIKSKAAAKAGASVEKEAMVEEEDSANGTPTKGRKRHNLPFEEIVEDDSKEAVSPLQFCKDGDSVSYIQAEQAPRVARHLPLKDKTVPWAVQWKDMKDSGWGYKTGDGLISYYWVHPTYAHLSKVQLVKECTPGVDYFTEEEDVKYYAHKTYGWLGDYESPISAKSGLELGERIKKSRRAEKAAKRSIIAKPVVASVKSNVKMVAKKSAKNERKSPSASTRVTTRSKSDESEESRFSQGGSGDEGIEEQHGLKGKRLSYGRKRMTAILNMKQTSGHGDSVATESTAACSSDLSSGEDTSVDLTYQIIKSCDAWKLLMQLFGFTYTRGKYCLPGKENKPSEASAQEGKNFFDTIQELRENLCAYGLPESKKALSDEEKVDIARWVRYAHLSGVADGANINEEYIGGHIDQKEAWVLLQQLGLKYSTGYTIPKTATRELKKFDRVQDFYAHIARFGIPRCDKMPGPPLDEKTRLKLDLFVYDPDSKHLDTFKRINPESNEVTPRRTRHGTQPPSVFSPSSAFSASLSVKQTERANKPRKQKQPSKFEQDFNNLETQRDLPSRLINCDDAVAILQKHYGIRHDVNSDGSLYCFIDAYSNEEVKFGNQQDLRENLCAFGLPTATKGSNISKEEQSNLEFWIRCAHVKDVRDDHLNMDVIDYKDAKSVIQRLGYKISKDTGLYALPNANFVNPIMGKDSWNDLLGFFNHIARFGLVVSTVASLPSSEDVLRFQMFVLTVATSDLSQRMRCDNFVKQSTSQNTESLIIQSSTFETEEFISNGHDAPYDNENTLLTQPAMIEPHESPAKYCSPEKKSKDQPGILGFFKQVKKYLTPTHTNATFPSLQYSPQQCESPELSVSCLKQGEEEIEKCFTDFPSKQSSASIHESHLDGDVAANCSPSKRKAEDMLTEEVAVKKTPAEQVDSRKIVHLSAAKDPWCSWPEMESQMRREGLWFMSGTGLSSYWYILPTFVGMKRNEIMAQCTEGKDYFTSDESLKLYAKTKLGWAGEVESEIPDGKRRSRREPFKLNSTPKRKAVQETSSPSKKARKSPESKTNEVNSSPRSETPSCDDNDDDEDICIPDMQSNVKDKLEAAEMVLHPSSEGFYCSNSTKTSEIMEFMATSVVESTELERSQRSRFLYVCGRPGTGKTTVVTQCGKDTQCWAKSEGYDKPIIVSSNMASLFASSNAKDGIMKGMLRQVSKRIGIEKDPSIRSLEKKAQKNVIIFIIDEIDMLIKKRNSDGESFLFELVRLANDEHLQFSLIGISNSVNDVYSARIKDVGAPQEIVFSSYDENGLLNILKKRVGEKTVDAKALELVSRKIAATSGDARRVLQITMKAIGRCRDTSSEEFLLKAIDPQSSSADEKPPVKISHMMWAIRESNVIKHAHVIQTLPQLAKVVLCIAVAYGNVMGPKAEISMTYLKKLCVISTKFALFDDSDIGSVCNLCETLCDSGLLRVANNDHFDPHDPNAKMLIDVQLDDVECALEESLFNGENGTFYAKLADFVKTRHGH